MLAPTFRCAALSPAQAAEVLGVTRQTIYRMIERGELRRYKLGRLTKLNARQVYATVGATPNGDNDAPAA